MHTIIKELNTSNSTTHKTSVLTSHKNNETLKKTLSLTYDKTKYSFGIKKIPQYTSNSNNSKLSLDEALDYLVIWFCSRKYTGNEASEKLKFILESLTEEDSEIITGVIKRDLRLNFGKTIINKVWKDLIIDPPYMRCGIYSEKTSSKIKFPAIVQVKADGMYQAVIVDNNEVTFTSRSGEEREFPILESLFNKFPNGVYIGELLINNITSRSEANGLINSDNPPHNDIYIQLWDYVSLNEYRDAKHEDRNIPRMVYSDRFDTLGNIVVGIPNDGEFKHVRYIETKIVDNIQLALKVTSEWMNNGYEGSILKDLNNVFKDHTSPTQLKLKLEIEIDVRVTGFTDGTKGTKRESTFGAITYQNDEGTIIGQCSGFTDKQLEEFNNNREQLIGKVMSVMCNDLTKGRDNDYYALSHPRFIEFRNDKDTTDSLERALELKNSAMMLGEK